jgi:hypothetical protein
VGRTIHPALGVAAQKPMTDASHIFSGRVPRRPAVDPDAFYAELRAIVAQALLEGRDTVEALRRRLPNHEAPVAYVRWLVTQKPADDV